MGQHQREALASMNAIEVDPIHLGFHLPLAGGVVVTDPAVLPERRGFPVAASLAGLMAPMPLVDVAQLGCQHFIAARAVAAFITGCWDTSSVSGAC